MTPQEEQDFIKSHISKLMEHFDSVQIFTSITESGNTRAHYNGAGDWYARRGMAHEFLNKDVAQEHAECLASKLNPPDDAT